MKEIPSTSTRLKHLKFQQVPLSNWSMDTVLHPAPNRKEDHPSFIKMSDENYAHDMEAHLLAEEAERMYYASPWEAVEALTDCSPTSASSSSATVSQDELWRDNNVDRFNYIITYSVEQSNSRVLLVQEAARALRDQAGRLLGQNAFANRQLQSMNSALQQMASRLSDELTIKKMLNDENQELHEHVAEIATSNVQLRLQRDDLISENKHLRDVATRSSTLVWFHYAVTGLVMMLVAIYMAM